MMQQFLGDYAAWFTVPAVVGTLYFLVQLVFMNLGEIDADVDGDGGHGHDGGGDLRIVSTQSISAFFMGAGWIGLTAYRLADFSFGAACFAALLGGIGAGWLLIGTSKLILKLQSSGNIGLGETTGLTGDVSVRIPAAGQGRGRVKLVVHTRLREYDAVQDGDEDLASGTRVKVERADTAANTLTVRPTE